jgi:dihydropteroate synthase
MFWQTSRFRIDLARPQVMGIVNVTPDSFSDGGQNATTAAALRHCEKLLKDGADILDIGGESTRPGSPAISHEEELARVVPLVHEATKLGVPVSVDTYKPEVMQAVLDLGADIINDIAALSHSGAARVVARHPSCGVCLMHMHREPQTMQVAPMEGDVVAPVRAFLAKASARIRALGVNHDRIALDPGVGFGKTVVQNFSLLARQDELLTLGFPLLVGWSRKSSLGAVIALRGQSPAPAERVTASVVAALLAVERGASIVRVHDVRATVQGLQVLQAVQAASADI